jgi:hypothetical protein
MSTSQIELIDAWWAAFTKRTGDLCDLFANRKPWEDLPIWMHHNLRAIDRHLAWEFGPAIHGNGHRLVITSEWRRDLRPLVKQILSRAPKLDGWEFYPYRLPEDFGMVDQFVKTRSGGSVLKTFFRATVNEINKIDLCFLAPDYSSNEDKQAMRDVCVATETLLGEEVFNQWIGRIEVAPLDHGPDEPQNIRDLKPVVEELIGTIKSRLPNVPYFQLNEEVSQETPIGYLYKMTPQEADDYPNQWDMFVGKSTIDPMWRNAHTNESFDSVRFSNHGEVFCYLKIDGTNNQEECRFSDKGEIEDAVDAALCDAEIGCFVGGGTGLRYSYIDLALLDVERSLEILRPLLREGNIPKRTWLLFFDSDLQNEWIGIWDDTPAPPMVNYDEG